LRAQQPKPVDKGNCTAARIIADYRLAAVYAGDKHSAFIFYFEFRFLCPAAFDPAALNSS